MPLGRLRDVLTCWSHRHEEEECRTVYVLHQHITDDVAIKNKQYPNNVVVSSKYTAWNFIPKNLFEQFRRIANFYFLCIGAVQLIIDSPVSPMTSILPLIFVVSVTAIKQGYEDWQRHQADKEVNNRVFRVVKNGKLVNSDSKHIEVGDVVQVNTEEEFPCDLVLLSSSEDDGTCYVTTANLDGETNLKVHSSLPDTLSLQTGEQISDLIATVECQHPDVDLYRYTGRLKIYSHGNTQPEVRSLGPTQLLLRGAKLKNTPTIMGVAVYTGKDTKMALNQQESAHKFSRVEKSMNTFLLIYLGLLLLQGILCTSLKHGKYSSSNFPYVQSESGGALKVLEDFLAFLVLFNYVIPISMYVTIGLGGSRNDYKEDDKHDDEDKVDDNDEEEEEEDEALKVLEDFLAFLVLFNYVIPISMYVTIELMKFIGAQFFNWDVEMYNHETDEPAKANTSDLNEELGQVEYLFSDKTGTLTENDMQFRLCSINGIKYEETDKQLQLEGRENQPVILSSKLDPDIVEFFKTLALCHTIQASKETDPDAAYEYHYQASSPDEKAFVEVAARFGIIFKGSIGDELILQVHDTIEKFKLLHVLEFDSTRKRMSVILQDQDDKYILLCKGAETAILDRVACGPTEGTLEHIDQYAKKGLRTLAIASKYLSDFEYNEIDDKMRHAKQAINDREEQLERVFDEIENDLRLLGATAVEDRLQDGVKQTLESLRDAGIKVWVLTGDKQETAVNISYSCGHFKFEGQTILYVVKQKSAKTVKHFYLTTRKS